MKSISKILIDAERNNEPVFLIRAKDKCSIAALAAYNVACHIAGVEENQLSETKQIYRDFLQYQTENPDKVKLPD